MIGTTLKPNAAAAAAAAAAEHIGQNSLSAMFDNLYNTQGRRATRDLPPLFDGDHTARLWRRVLGGVRGGWPPQGRPPSIEPRLRRLDRAAIVFSTSERSRRSV